jgi:hypothetical protein
VVWLVSGAHGQFWPIWVALLVLIPLLRNGWRLYGPAPQLDQVERELESPARRGERQAERHVARAERHVARDERRAARHEGGGTGAERAAPPSPVRPYLCCWCRTCAGSITNLIRSSPGWRNGYSSCPMYFLLSALMCSSAPSRVAVAFPRIST